MTNLLKVAKNSQKILLNLTPKAKKEVILDMAAAVEAARNKILNANKIDVENAQKKGLNGALIERLKLDDKKIDAILASLKDTALLPDPIGRVLDGWTNYAGLKFKKISIPLGVVCVIYESRPNVSAEVASLCFKSGNVAILKGGSEAQDSNLAIISAIKSALRKNKIDENCVVYLENFKHSDLNELLKMDKFIDVIVPRGGSNLINYITQNSKIPVIKHDKGMCHIFIDESADISDSVRICINAKCQKPSACNAVETILIHRKIANEILPILGAKFAEFGVKVHGNGEIGKFMSVLPIDEESFDTEYLDFELNLKLVNSVEEAISHIEKHGSSHSEAILSQNAANIEKFLNELDSACLYANASTRFSDGFEFGFGAEVGISTNKLHARGPMGLNELTTYKYQIVGNGQIRE